MPHTHVHTSAHGIGYSGLPASLDVRAHFTSRPRKAVTVHTAVLEERARIARELHDSVSQTLYAISIGASRARTLLQRNDTERGQHVIEEVLQLAAAGQLEVRALLSDIRSDVAISEGLVVALEKLVGDVKARHALEVRLSAVEKPTLPAHTAEALVLIAREALHNVTKHAAARRVDIVLERTPEELVMWITDDGGGFDLAKPCPGHFGLQSMRERASSTGCALTLFSSVGHGTRLRVSVPLHVRPHG